MKNKNILKENTDINSNLKIYNNPENSFYIDFKVFGKSIFQNMVLNVTAYEKSQNRNDDNIEKNCLPIKCIWKKVHNETEIILHDIVSNSYIPNAEDIGYIIKVYVELIDQNLEEKQYATATYGPIELSNEFKNTIEMLLSQGEVKFLCNYYNQTGTIINNEREFEIVINNEELKLIEYLQSSKPIVIEKVKLNILNPIIKLNQLDSNRFKLEFIETEITGRIKDNKENALDVKSKIKSSYELIMISKSQRELLYLIINCFIFDEKLKNKKLFSNLNFKLLSEEKKIEIIDLISEIKTLKEENQILINNSLVYEKENLILKEELKDLEEDFQLTIQQINSISTKLEFTSEDDKITKNYNVNHSDLINTGNHYNNLINKSENLLDIKNKYDELNLQYSNLLSKEKALREDNQNFQNKIDCYNGEILESNFKNSELSNKINELKNENLSIQKANNFLTELNNKISSERDDFYEKLKIANQKLDIIEHLNDNQSKKDIEIERLKREILGLEEKFEKISYDFSNLKIQYSVLKSQKDDITSEIKILLNEKELIKSKFIQKENDYVELEEKYKNILSVTNGNNFGFYNGRDNSSSILDESVYRINKEEYEEYDNFKKERDELECKIMYLSSNNEALRVEIDLLKNEINK